MNPWIPHLLRAGGGGGAVLPPTGRTMLANLTSSLILDEGTGGPTWSRPTKAWRFNERGYLEEIASGCTVFGGARLVRNAVSTKSEDVSNAAWVKTAVTAPSANTIVCANATSAQSVYNNNNYSTAVGSLVQIKARLTYVDTAFVQFRSGGGVNGTAYANFDLVNGIYSLNGVGGIAASIVAVSAGVYDCIFTYKTTNTIADTAFSVGFVNSLSSSRASTFIGDGVKSFGITRAQVCDVTNYDASYVPEYVSVGVEASPYFGAGVDGAKYFETDWQGAPIAAANLLGFRREAAATNNLLHSRDLSNAAWSTKTNITAAKTATGLDGIANTATTLTATAADAIILQPITLASAARCASAYVKRRTGTGTISFTQDGGSTWTDITSQINSSTWSRVEITATLANPSVGFKISTSGDAIDVDCVQNEAGTKATSPIVTTTATITRNDESLTYQTAGNWSDTAGTVFVQISGYEVDVDKKIFGGANGIYSTTLTSGVYASDGTTTVRGPIGAAMLNAKIAMSWGGITKTISVNGSLGAVDAYDGAWSPASLAVGGKPGYIGPVAIYNYQMTDAELHAITA